MNLAARKRKETSRKVEILSLNFNWFSLSFQLNFSYHLFFFFFSKREKLKKDELFNWKEQIYFLR